ncbi:hypothetical protein WA556_003462 [Blastocystis sp. ATCC 50177/Nand II]
MLLKTNGFYYQIKGRCALLFEEPFFSTYISAPNGVTLSTIHTPVFCTNSLCLFRGEYVVVKLDKESYCTLGLPAKHSSAHLQKDNTYISVIRIKELKESGKLFQRLQSCFQDLPPLDMVCYYDDKEIVFPDEFEVTKVKNTITTHRVTNCSIPILSEAVLRKGMVLDRPRVDEMEEKVYLEQLALRRIDRDGVLNGVLDWLGCIEARSSGMSVETGSMFSSFALSSALEYVSTKSSAVSVYREKGLCTATRVLDKMELLIRQVNTKKLPFACLSVYGTNDCCGEGRRGE